MNNLEQIEALMRK